MKRIINKIINAKTLETVYIHTHTDSLLNKKMKGNKKIAINLKLEGNF